MFRVVGSEFASGDVNSENEAILSSITPAPPIRDLYKRWASSFTGNNCYQQERGRLDNEIEFFTVC